MGVEEAGVVGVVGVLGGRQRVTSSPLYRAQEHVAIGLCG